MPAPSPLTCHSCCESVATTSRSKSCLLSVFRLTLNRTGVLDSSLYECRTTNTSRGILIVSWASYSSLATTSMRRHYLHSRIFLLHGVCLSFACPGTLHVGDRLKSRNQRESATFGIEASASLVAQFRNSPSLITFGVVDLTNLLLRRTHGTCSNVHKTQSVHTLLLTGAVELQFIHRAHSARRPGKRPGRQLSSSLINT